MAKHPTEVAPGLLDASKNVRKVWTRGGLKAVRSDPDSGYCRLKLAEVAIKIDVRSLDFQVHCFVDRLWYRVLDARAILLLDFHILPARSEVDVEALFSDRILLRMRHDLQPEF